MQMVYLGLFSKIFNWVFNKILSPVVDFISKLLGEVLEWLFETVLIPILNFVLKSVLSWLIDLIMDILGKIFYIILAGLFKIIDYISMGFDIFIGITDVTYVDSVTKVTKSGSLLEAFFAIDGISKGFAVITALGMGIALLLAIYAMIKSTLDFDFENKRPVGAVLKSLMKTFIQFLIIPIMIMIMVRLSAIILSGINVALTTNSKATLGSMLFFITSLNAGKGSVPNISNSSPSFDFATGIRKTFLENDVTYNYLNIDTVGSYFDYAEFDYVVGIIVSIFLIIILLICIVTFIQRLFEILILYLSAPLFVAMTPVDDGEKFSKWREMFVAKCFTGYGSIIGMKLYMILCPTIIIGNSITFGTSGTSAESTYLLKLIFLLGGAWALLKVGPMLTTLLNYQAGMGEQQTSGMVSATVTGYGQSAFRKMLSSSGKNEKKEKPKTEEKEEQKWKSAKAYGQGWSGDNRKRAEMKQKGVQIGFHRSAAMTAVNQSSSYASAGRPASTSGATGGGWTKGATSGPGGTWSRGQSGGLGGSSSNVGSTGGGSLSGGSSSGGSLSGGSGSSMAGDSSVVRPSSVRRSGVQIGSAGTSSGKTGNVPPKS